jgi:chromosome segregation ATPase
MQRNSFGHWLPIVLGSLVLMSVLGAISHGGVAAERSGNEAADQGTDLETLKADWAKALETLKGYSAAQREEAVEAAQAQLDAMDAQMERLEHELAAQWEDLSVAAREQREATLRSLRAQRRELAEWYGGMKHSSRNAWEDVKQGFIKAYDALGESFGNAVEQFEQD